MNEWIQNLLDIGLKPYVATSELLLNSLDLSIFEGQEVVKILEDPKHRSFHEAYLVSNSLGFGNPDLKMPNWVYIDCVLLQSAVIGFAIPVEKAPDTLVEFYERDPYVDVQNLDYIPISGQIAGLGIDGNTLVGFSLFSLRRQLPDLNIPRLAHFTKYAALHVYKAGEKEKFIGISQYDNKALATHALFGEKMYIERTTLALHPLRDMSFTYSMHVDLNEKKILSDQRNTPAQDFDFLLQANDNDMKIEIQNRITSGERFYIADPIHVEKENNLYLPICVEKKNDEQ